jgi:predicted MPP superfamily phosphohydrolase
MMYPPRVTRREFLKVVALSGTALVPARSSAAEVALTRSPYVMNVSENSATILWAMSAPVAGSVIVGDDPTRVQTAASTIREFPAAETGLSGAYYQHESTLTNLKPGTTYSYRIQVNGQPLTVPVAGPLQFRTPDDRPFNFLHFADSGSGNNGQFQLAKQMTSEDVSLVLANGDLAYDNATFQSIESNYFAVYRELMARIPFFTTLGNHEYYTDLAKPSLSGRATPIDGVPPADRGRYYSFDWGNVHFVALDTNAPLTGAIAGDGQMLNFLESTLQNTRKFWRIVFFHHPPYATGKHQDEEEAALVRRYIVPILEKHGVQLVFSGHEHTYQRTHPLFGGVVVDPDNGGIVYVTSGGGGADPLYTAPNALVARSLGVNNYVRAEVAGSTITLRTIALGASGEADSIRLAPKPGIVGPAVNAASFTTDLAAGGIVTIRGRNLCASEFMSSSNPVTEVAGAFVGIDGMRIPLLYAGPERINAQIPFSITGAATLEVTTPNGSASTSITVAPIAPALFLTGNAAAASHVAGTMVTVSSLLKLRNPSSFSSPAWARSRAIYRQAHFQRLLSVRRRESR